MSLKHDLVTKAGLFFTPSVITLIAANLVPVYGVLFEGWSISDIMILFWLENVIIGLLNVFKILLLLVLKSDLSALFLAPFFALHYGAFCFVHGIFIITLFGKGQLMRFSAMPEYILSLLTPALLLYPALLLMASHVFSLIFNFLIGREYTKTTAGDLMGQPYARVIVLHLVVLLGGGIILMTGSSMAALLLLIFLKICIDLKGHLKERQTMKNEKMQNAGKT